MHDVYVAFDFHRDNRRHDCMNNKIIFWRPHSQANQLIFYAVWSAANIYELRCVSLMCTWTNGWANSRYVGDLGHTDGHCDITAISYQIIQTWHMDICKLNQWLNNNSKYVKPSDSFVTSYRYYYSSTNLSIGAFLTDIIHLKFMLG